MAETKDGETYPMAETKGGETYPMAVTKWDEPILEAPTQQPMTLQRGAQAQSEQILTQEGIDSSLAEGDGAQGGEPILEALAQQPK